MNWIKPDWPAAKNIHAAVTLRTGGSSSGMYKSLNLATHVNDEPEIVHHNRQIISQMLNLPAEPFWLQQVHGNHVIKAGNYTKTQPADASYSNKAATVCVVLTADCLPILLASSDGSQIAAIHAGWRGLLAGVIRNTVKALETTHLIAWLGPAIGPDCFEVGAEVKDEFINKSLEYAPAFSHKQSHKYLLDIYRLAIIELATLGITQVYGGNYCTVTDKQKFYSYRRDGETGRMATLIWRD